jgi:uncharacterized membrane protein YgdD (TMEM256/DUF423 family)
VSGYSIRWESVWVFESVWKVSGYLWVFVGIVVGIVVFVGILGICWFSVAGTFSPVAPILSFVFVLG